MGIVDRAANGSHSSRRIPAVILLDVKNTYNSLTWEVIMWALKKTAISPYLLRTNQGYFMDRNVTADTEEGVVNFLMQCGVPQESVLGPDLRNLAYLPEVCCIIL